jgi:hypothetical protein
LDKVEGRGQRAEGGREKQKAEGRRRKAGGRRRERKSGYQVVLVVRSVLIHQLQR